MDHQDLTFDSSSFDDVRQVAALTSRPHEVCISKISFASGLSTMAVLLLLAITLAVILWSKLLKSRLIAASSFESRIDSPFGHFSDNILGPNGTLRSTKSHVGSPSLLASDRTLRSVTKSQLGSVNSQFFMRHRGNNGIRDNSNCCQPWQRAHSSAAQHTPATLDITSCGNDRNRKSESLRSSRSTNSTVLSTPVSNSSQTGLLRQRRASEGSRDELLREKVGSARSDHNIRSIKNPAFMLQFVRQLGARSVRGRDADTKMNELDKSAKESKPERPRDSDDNNDDAKTSFRSENLPDIGSVSNSISPSQLQELQNELYGELTVHSLAQKQPEYLFGFDDSRSVGSDELDEAHSSVGTKKAIMDRMGTIEKLLLSQYITELQNYKQGILPRPVSDESPKITNPEFFTQPQPRVDV